MTQQWLTIAKVEILVRTAKIRRIRKIGSVLIVALFIAWALFIVPTLMKFLLERFSFEFNTLIQTVFPGLMRSLMLFVWLVVLVIPISNALEGIKIGQWEIMLSNNVKTKDILFGTFIGKIPVFGLVVLFLSPLIIAPFAIAFEVSVIGQLLMNCVVVAFALITLWISNVLITAISAKIGDSPKGNDIAKALSWAVIPIIAIPGMGVMYFMGSAAKLMTMDIFILLPSTWCADFLTWIAIAFNGVNLPASSVMNLGMILTFGPIIDFALLCSFSAIVLFVGFHSADRLFSLGTGGGSNVGRAGPENFLFRSVRRVFGPSSGTLVVSSLKDFCRKLQNISKLMYGLFLSVVFVALMKFGPFGNLVNDSLFLPAMTTLMVGAMLAIFGGITFGGVGFLDSSDQLWMIKSTPRGELKFIRARITSYLLFAIPYVFIPSTLATVLMGYGVVEFLAMSGFFFTALCGTIMIGIGITAFNPSYDDTSSSAFTINTVATMFVTIIVMFCSFLPAILIVINERSYLLGIFFGSIPWIIAGLVVLSIGVIRLVRSETA